MTLILRRAGPTSWHKLKAGRCRVSLCELVGAFGRGPVRRVVFLGE